LGKFPDSQVLSLDIKESKKKTESQKKAQSNKLKERFKTPEGEVTRKQISKAAHEMQESGYREKASAFLTQLNRREDMRVLRRSQSKARWEDPKFVLKMKEYQVTHREEVLESAAKARGHIKRTFSNPHRLFEEALVKAGVEGFHREFRVGYYHLDEAFPSIKLCVEIDGCYWHGCSECGFEPNRDIANLDKRKTTYLTKRGWLIIRVPEHDSKDYSGWVAKVKKAVDDLGGTNGSGNE
jgi:very-short-patch-repair endonuclease